MAALDRRLRAAERSVDIIADKEWDQLAIPIAEVLDRKGFCIIKPDWRAGIVRDACEEARTLRKSGKLQLEALPEEIKDGVIGSSGSYRVAEIHREMVDEDSVLFSMDKLLDRLGSAFQPILWHRNRTSTMLNISGAPDPQPIPLSELTVSAWREVFMLQRIMILIFLGPNEGILELQSVAGDDGDIVEVATEPGQIIIVRPDWLWRTHVGQSKTYVLSCCLLDPKPPFDLTGASMLSSPCLEVLDSWMVLRLRELKDKEPVDDQPDYWRTVPSDWIRRMNHLFYKGHAIGVYALSGRLPMDWNVQQSFNGQVYGMDTVTMVPMSRWFHNDLFLPNELSWMEQKTYCAHGSFIDGVELFDNRFFRIQNNEAANMDPHQRHILEVSYEILAKHGMTQASILGTHCGVYVGMSHHTDWDYAEWDAAGHEPRGVYAGTASATAIASNRVSFCLGMKGPSMTLDTDAASGLSAIHTAAESVEPRGRRVRPCSQSLALGAHLNLSKAWWPMHCARRHLSISGRCMSFSMAADGYVLGDAVAGLLLKCHNEGADDQTLQRLPTFGTLAGISMSNNGKAAGLFSAHAPAQMQVLNTSMQNASIRPLDVDAVEAHAPGEELRDAIEGNVVSSVLRDSIHFEDPVMIGAAKTSMANSLAASGTTSFLRALLSCQSRCLAPSLHLAQVNNELNMDMWSGQLHTEATTYKLESAYISTLAHGFGGTNVCGLVWAKTVWWDIDDKDDVDTYGMVYAPWSLW
mmetsp:Transcript_6111/g.10556  ORF Transcript_6111/g.10556 Transcript_6111/m.10556 type:complete len:749 (-) Transcript_6111:99-2345(-)